MNVFELSSEQASNNGRRHFKAILHEIFPDSCIDETKKEGTKYNKNGITWIRQYCEVALPSIAGMYLKCEFVDEKRTELYSHGLTESVAEDGLPAYENAVVIGYFDKGYIEDIIMPNGEQKTFCVGEGTIDGNCYKNLCNKLEEDIANGNAPSGSVEILKTNDNEEIVYKYGYKELGRIPMIFEYSGYALLGVQPADSSAKIVELNNEEVNQKMNDDELRKLIRDVANEVANSTTESVAKITEANSKLEVVVSEKNELVASVAQIKKALEDLKNEYEELNKKYHDLYNERQKLEEALAEAQAKERISELNAQLASFTPAEQAYAKDDIDAFNKNPMSFEVNSVISKVWEGIGKTAKKAAVTAEQNNFNPSLQDIFAGVGGDSANDDMSIF